MKAEIDELLRAAVDRGDVPNAVAVAADRDGVIYEGGAGPRAVGSADAAGPDTTFRLASMTKMITTAAVHRLVEQGRIDLDAPVASYRPEFDDLMVLESVEGDTPKLRPPASRATVRQLASHTSGLGYWFWNADLVAWEAATGVPNVLAGDARAFTAPLVADPGTKIVYGHSTDWLGLILETVSGQSIDVHLKESILEPLGMASTAFAIPEDQRAGLSPVHVKGEAGAWVATDIDWPREPDWWPGGHGLYSTPRDYLRFQRMLLSGGELDSVRVLSRESVDAAFSNQVGELTMPEVIPTASPMHSCDFPTGPGRVWGLGLMLNTQQEAGMRAPWSGAWAGLCNSHFWVDRTTGVTGAIYSQFLPFVTPESMELYAEFEKALYTGL
ncbi:serine hydrolase domain-containing protein [Pseudonocardia xishanensis]|uniref:Serine hydrolase domain-containing protein n=1 Tax=Pseudonocardia xishanensis TaxID=630995 RepID=A0ABP8RVT5_9PSEU